jgi:hypothetical protein
MISVIYFFCIQAARAQDRLYRCDNNFYTNDLKKPEAVNCKPVEGGNVTVVQGVRPPPTAASAASAAGRPAAPPTAGGSAPRVDSADQKARDSDARAILEAELKKAESRRTELAREFNNGEPEKRGDETRNHQKYLDRVNEIKSALARTDNDIGGIQRELQRLPK